MARKGGADFHLRIIADIKQVVKTVREANTATGGLLFVLGKWGLALEAIKRVYKDIKAAIVGTMKAALESVKLTQRLDVMTRLWGDSTGQLTSKIAQTAQALQEQTGASDDVYKAGAAILLMSHQLTAEQLPKLMEIMGDMSALMGEGPGGITSAARLLSRAMEGGFESLSRWGIRFTDEEKALQDELRATGREVEANDIIIRKLQETLGGVGAGQNRGMVGTLNAVKTTWDDIQESVGRILMPRIHPALEAVAASLKTIANILDHIERFEMPAKPEDFGQLAELTRPGMQPQVTTTSVGWIEHEEWLRRVEEGRKEAEEMWARIKAADEEEAKRLAEEEWARTHRGMRPESILGLRPVRERSMWGEAGPPKWITDLEVEGPKAIEVVGAAWEEMQKKMAESFRSAVIDPITDAFSNLVLGVKTDFEALWKSIAASFLKAGIGRLLQSAFNLIPGLGPLLGSLLSFQSGGVVPGPLGQPRLAVVHGGETVSPTHHAGGGPTPAPIYVVTSDPTTMIRVGRETYGRDNRYVSTLTTRNIARELY